MLKQRDELQQQAFEQQQQLQQLQQQVQHLQNSMAADAGGDARAQGSPEAEIDLARQQLAQIVYDAAVADGQQRRSRRPALPARPSKSQASRMLMAETQGRSY